MDEKFRSRKWLLIVFIQCTATVALLCKLLTGADFALISATTAAAYPLSNAAESFANRKNQG